MFWLIRVTQSLISRLLLNRLLVISNQSKNYFHYYYIKYVQNFIDYSFDCCYHCFWCLCCRPRNLELLVHWTYCTLLSRVPNYYQGMCRYNHDMLWTLLHGRRTLQWRTSWSWTFWNTWTILWRSSRNRSWKFLRHLRLPQSWWWLWFSNDHVLWLCWALPWNTKRWLCSHWFKRYKVKWCLLRLYLSCSRRRAPSVSVIAYTTSITIS